MDELFSLLGVPSIQPTAVDWDDVEAKLGTGLPADYKMFSDRYPALFVNQYLRVAHPSCVDPDHNLLLDAQTRTKSLSELAFEFPSLYPHPVYPEVGGLLCWGNNVNGEQCYWLTQGDPDGWKVVVGDEIDYCWEYDGGFSKFLLQSFTGVLDHDFYGPFTGPLTEVEFIR
ncbi:hypothetical protein ACFORH_11235 [Amycolatopsis roodepoortensis]|uniref:SMI1/KNR4 family protein n=1 Tax=Amycolatopsis roodepoortensis TaxID=700274 RepID=A0ABR9LAN7_9PSEU|nr:hypothetical protein [Amycolatopsis roodepoortensis]MBE1577758.1 hypothetical protein [Amycolatopsis roodepoortensis]